MRNSTPKKTHWCFGAFHGKRAGSQYSKLVRSALTMYLAGD
jgi:hypothetical protein